MRNSNVSQSLYISLTKQINRQPLEMQDFRAYLTPHPRISSTIPNQSPAMKTSNMALLRLAVMTGVNVHAGNSKDVSNKSIPNFNETSQINYKMGLTNSFTNSSDNIRCEPESRDMDGIYFKQAGSINQVNEVEEVHKLLRGILLPSSRAHSITELCKRSDIITGLGALLWNSPSVVQVLLLEMMTLYPLLNPPQLTGEHLQHVSSILALLQQILLDNSVKDAFLESRCQFYIIPFLAIEGISRDIEHLRVSLLSFIATIVQKAGRNNELLEQSLDLLNSDVIHFTVSGVKSCCTDVGKSLAVLVLNRLLYSNKLLESIAESRERFHDIVFALGSLVKNILQKLPSMTQDARESSLAYFHQCNTSDCQFDKLLQVLIYTVKTLVRLCDNETLRDALHHCIVRELMDRSLFYLYPNMELQRALVELWKKLKVEMIMPISNQSAP